MKNLTDPAIQRYRDAGADTLYGTKDNERALGGAFLIPFKPAGALVKEWMRVIASSGKDQPEGWRFDHVSVSLSNRCPTWEEMDFIKRLFFLPDEVAYQLHVTADEHISNHPYCLHLWRALDVAIPLPPAMMVGFKELGK